MPKRKEHIVTGEIYHVYNKSVGSEQLFLGEFYLNQALNRIRYYKFEVEEKYILYSHYKRNIPADTFIRKNSDRKNPLIDIYAYAIMPNHFHFIIKELKVGGLRFFISNFQKSYARFYNAKNKRIGVVFQGRFKIKRITNTEQFIHIVRYIHLNPVTACMFDFKELSKSALTSYTEYLGLNKYKIVNTDFVLRNFASIDEFKMFHKNQVDYQRKLFMLKKLLIE